MKVISYTDMASAFQNQKIHTVRTRNRQCAIKPHVDLSFRDDDHMYQLRTQRGWKISSVLLNTLLYSPVIEKVETDIDGDELHYTLYAKGTYIIAEFSARRLPGSTDVAAFPFELVQLDLGDEYVNVLDRRHR